MQKTWLTCCAFMVILMIFVGGWTRLTDSGLSIVEWKPITGILPPLTQDSWEAEFSSYKTSPEYHKLNKDFSLNDFKNIFWLEFIHRILGRITGLVIILPFIFFAIKKQLLRPGTYIAMSILVILQGVMGWYMVKSGLVDNPYVSHYRLAAHLMLAIALYSVVLWEIFEVSSKATKPSSYGLTIGSTNQRMDSSVKHYYDDKRDNDVYAIATLLFIYIQIFLGALVAGLDAGMIYNEYPLMGGSFVPSEFTISWQMLNDAASVQFLHRTMAYIVLVSSFLLSYRLMKHNKKLAITIIVAVIGQILLGVFTILYIVPLKLALAHQLFAVLLLSVVLYAIFETRRAS